ncbi:MAG: hypothetical protein ACK58L_13605 [Planctomycetota bacterium]
MSIKADGLNHLECYVDVPSGFAELAPDLQISLLNERMCRPDLFSDAFDLECDASAVHPDLKSLRIQSVRVTGSTVTIGYCLQFSEWRACLMESRDWLFRREIMGRLSERRITFVRFQPSERRSTVEEF